VGVGLSKLRETKVACLWMGEGRSVSGKRRNNSRGYQRVQQWTEWQKRGRGVWGNQS